MSEMSDLYYINLLLNIINEIKIIKNSINIRVYNNSNVKIMIIGNKIYQEDSKINISSLLTVAVISI